MKKTEESFFRFSIISQLLHQNFKKGELRKKLLELSKRPYLNPKGNYRMFSYKTLEEWYYKFKNQGISGLENKQRKDCGIQRVLPQEVTEQILRFKDERPNITVPQILRKLIAEKIIEHGEFSKSTVYRLLRERDNIKLSTSTDGKEKRKFSFPFTNDCWQCDVCHGPYLYIKDSNKKRKIYIYAFIDDASRVIPHAGIAFRENMVNFIGFLKIAIQKKGLPKMVYTDNASYFKNPVIQTIAKNTGIKIIYCTPYSPYKKGKIERWFRTMRGNFLSSLDKQKSYSLPELNDLLSAWVEQEYHHNTHDSLQMSPIEAWFQKRGQIKTVDKKFMNINFLAETTRKVKNDGTISLNSKYYEIDSCYAGNWVTVRYDPFIPTKIYIYYKNNFLQEAFVVDEHENHSAFRKILSPIIDDERRN
jgi:transposase InsO family protein